MIDTPGFGDTRGKDQNDKIVSQIRELLAAKDEKSIDTIDAVCFLVRASDSGLPFKQNCESIMSLFGNDIKENMCTLVTFADGKKPLVLDQIEAIPGGLLSYNTYFTFNNSALYANNAENPLAHFSSFFWNMGIKSFKLFFAHIKALPTQSLKLTAEVLLSRENLSNTVANLQNEINKAISKMNTLEDETRIYTENIEAIEANKNFTYEVEELKQKVINLEGTGRYVNYCTKCNFTCHEECSISNDGNGAECSAMKDGVCTQCPRSCHWRYHNHMSYNIKYIKVKVKKTYDEMKTKYQQANAKKLTQEQVIEKIKKAIEDIDGQIQVLLEIIYKLINRLKGIALRQNPQSIENCFDYLIAAERNEAKIGFESRIHLLKRYKDHFLYHKKIQSFQTRLEMNLMSAN